MNELLADALAVLHALWVLFNLTGFFWARRWPLAGKVHVATLGVTLLIFATLGDCPVTDLEWRLRGRAPGGSFISHYFEKFCTVAVASDAIGWATAALFVLSVYLHLWRPWRNRAKI
jgi:hypothetical protein